MAAIAKTVVATGGSSGLGFEAVKQLLQQSQPYKVILGARNTKSTVAAFDALQFDKSANAVTVLPLDLANMKDVKSFSQQVLERLGQDKVDFLFLNAGMSKNAQEKNPHGSKWCESLIVNHTSQHYLVHLLREKLEASKSRIVFVSSGAICYVPDVSVLEKDLTPPSDAKDHAIYCETKFVQFLGALWWRRQLTGKCDVVAVSPGLIPNTGLARNSSVKLTMDMPDAKTVDVGAASLLAAFTKSDFPEDPQRVYLASWGEWWETNKFSNALDTDLQDKWCLSKEQIEKEEGISA